MENALINIESMKDNVGLAERVQKIHNPTINTV
jgi:hypothetical protein